MSWESRHPPFQHQRDELRAGAGEPWRGVFWEQGTGKTKLVLDDFAQRVASGEEDLLLVIAPSVVASGWIRQQVPAHVPEGAVSTLHWRSGSSKTKRQQRALEAILRGGPAVLSLSYDAARTPTGGAVIQEVLRRRRVYLVLDEAHRIKTPGSKIARAAHKFGPLAARRRALTGTPVTQSPFDYFSIFKFLHQKFWIGEGCRSFSAFKQRFGVWRLGAPYPHLLAYRDLDELREITGPFCSRVRKEDVLDLPPKLYSVLEVEMSAQQRSVYRRLREDLLLEISGPEFSGERDVVHHLARLTAFSQAASGWTTYVDELGKTRWQQIPGRNPRLEAALELLRDLHHPAIVWCRFNAEVDQIASGLGKDAVVIDGRTPPERRESAQGAFQSGRVQYLVSKPSAAGEGLTLHAARTVLYYSHGPSVVQRVQSEDRAHRIGQRYPVHYVDVVAAPVDRSILGALRAKQDVAALVTGDRLLTTVGEP